MLLTNKKVIQVVVFVCFFFVYIYDSKYKYLIGYIIKNKLFCKRYHFIRVFKNLFRHTFYDTKHIILKQKQKINTVVKIFLFILKHILKFLIIFFLFKCECLIHNVCLLSALCNNFLKRQKQIILNHMRNCHQTVEILMDRFIYYN